MTTINGAVGTPTRSMVLIEEETLLKLTEGIARLQEYVAGEDTRIGAAANAAANRVFNEMQERLATQRRESQEQQEAAMAALSARMQEQQTQLNAQIEALREQVLGSNRREERLLEENIRLTEASAAHLLRAESAEQERDVIIEQRNRETERAVLAEREGREATQQVALLNQQIATFQQRENATAQQGAELGQQATPTEQQMIELRQETAASNRRAEAADQRAQASDQRAQASDQRAQASDQRAAAAQEALALLHQRDEAADRLAQAAYQEAAAAQEELALLHQRATAADQLAQAAYQRATAAEEQLALSNQRATAAEAQVVELQRLTIETRQQFVEIAEEVTAFAQATGVAVQEREFLLESLAHQEQVINQLRLQSQATDWLETFLRTGHLFVSIGNIAMGMWPLIERAAASATVLGEYLSRQISPKNR